MKAEQLEAEGRKPSGHARTTAPTPDGLRRTASMGAVSMKAEGRKPSGTVRSQH